MAKYTENDILSMKKSMNDVSQLYALRANLAVKLIDTEYETDGKGSLYDQQMTIMGKIHDDLEKKLVEFREKSDLAGSIFRSYFNPPQYLLLIMEDLLLHSNKEYAAVKERIFDTLYERAVIININETLETVQDEELRKRLIADKWTRLLMTPSLEGWYLGKGLLDTQGQEETPNEMDSLESYYWEGALKEEYAKKVLAAELLGFEQASKIMQPTIDGKVPIDPDIEKKASAIRLAALLPFLEQEDKDKAFSKIKSTLRMISPDVLKKTKTMVNKSN